MDPEIFEMMQKSEQELQPKGIASFNNFYQSLKEPVVGNLGILDLYGIGQNFLNPTPFGMALTGIGALRNLKEAPIDKVGLDYFGGNYDPYGYKSDLSSGNLGARQDPFGRNIVSAFSNYEQNRINELKELTRLQNLGILNNKFKQNKLDFAQNYLEKVRQEREQEQRERARQAYADVYARADRQGFTGPGGGFDTSAADKAGTSEGSGQFESRSSRGRQGY
jgi:hypothetical protein